jgi:hypothetical protein
LWRFFHFCYSSWKVQSRIWLYVSQKLLDS